MVESLSAGRGRTGRRWVVALGVLALGVLPLLLFRCDSPSQSTSDSSGHAVVDDPQFVIAGDLAEAMWPGMTARVDLTMANPHGVALTVTGLTISVDGLRAPHADRLHPCSVDDFLVEQPDEDLRATVPAGTSRSLSGLKIAPGRWPKVGMRNRSVNQDGCKGAVLALVYSGHGTLRLR